MVENKRDNNIDFFRGIAALCIIFIHTVFWSGTVYTSYEMKSLSLLVDVPIFIFISGMSFNYCNSVFKTIKGFSKLWLKYVIFVVFYFLLIFIFDNDHFSLSSIVRAMFFNYSGKDIFPVVSGSLWFMFMYFVVSIFCDSIICLYNKYFKDLDNFKYLVIVSLLFYGISSYKPDFCFIGTDIFMYSFIYLLGYYLYNFKLKSTKIFIGLLGLLIFVYIIFINYMGLDFTAMQTYKFNYDIRYLLHSMFSILTVFFLKDKIKIENNNIFAFIGRNALLFYFTQGIAASILYFLLPYVNLRITLFKLMVMYIINVSLTFGMTLFIKVVVDKLPELKIEEMFIEKKVR